MISKKEIEAEQNVLNYWFSNGEEERCKIDNKIKREKGGKNQFVYKKREEKEEDEE